MEQAPKKAPLICTLGVYALALTAGSLLVSPAWKSSQRRREEVKKRYARLQEKFEKRKQEAEEALKYQLAHFEKIEGEIFARLSKNIKLLEAAGKKEESKEEKKIQDSSAAENSTEQTKELLSKIINLDFTSLYIQSTNKSKLVEKHKLTMDSLTRKLFEANGYEQEAANYRRSAELDHRCRIAGIVCAVTAAVGTAMSLCSSNKKYKSSERTIGAACGLGTVVLSSTLTYQLDKMCKENQEMAKWAEERSDRLF